MKNMSNALGCTSPHHGTSPYNKNIVSSITSSPMLSTSDSLTTLHSECWGNASPSMTSCAFASTCAWTAPHNDSQEKSRLLTSITQTWKNSSTIWNGTYVQKVLSIHFTKVAALRSPTPLSTNKEPRSLGPYPMNGNDEANASDQQQQPSTYTSAKKLLCSTCSYSKMIGSPP